MKIENSVQQHAAGMAAQSQNCLDGLPCPRPRLTLAKGRCSTIPMRYVASCCLLVLAASLTCTVSLVSQRTQLALKPLERMERGSGMELKRRFTLGACIHTARLRGGAEDSETETDTETEEEKRGGTPLASEKGKVVEQDEDSSDSSSSPSKKEELDAKDAPAETGGVEEVSAEQAEGEEEEEEEQPPPTPEMIRMMNERLWEAALEGNEPLAQKALDGGANVNAFCRGPDKSASQPLIRWIAADCELVSLLDKSQTPCAHRN